MEFYNYILRFVFKYLEPHPSLCQCTAQLSPRCKGFKRRRVTCLGRVGCRRSNWNQWHCPYRPRLREFRCQASVTRCWYQKIDSPRFSVIAILITASQVKRSGPFSSFFATWFPTLFPLAHLKRPLHGVFINMVKRVRIHDHQSPNPFSLLKAT